jgi:hypothetical protein
MMGGVSPETCWASYKSEIKFLCTVGSCWISYVSHTMMLEPTNIKYFKISGNDKHVSTGAFHSHYALVLCHLLMVRVNWDVSKLNSKQRPIQLFTDSHCGLQICQAASQWRNSSHGTQHVSLINYRLSNIHWSLPAHSLSLDDKCHYICYLHNNMIRTASSGW